MQPIKIDVIGLQPTERAFERRVDVFSAVAARVGVARASAERKFRGEHHLVSSLRLREKITDDALAASVGVTVGGVDEVAPGVEVAVQDGVGGFLRSPPAPIGAERHGSEAKRAHA